MIKVKCPFCGTMMTWTFSGYFHDKHRLECMECSATSPKGDTHKAVLGKFKPQLIAAAQGMYKRLDEVCAGIRKYNLRCQHICCPSGCASCFVNEILKQARGEA